MSSFERLDAIIANPEVRELAELVPAPAPEVGGRPRLYPAFMSLIFEASLSVFGSARRVETEFAHPIVWNWIRDRVAHHCDVDLPLEPMRRHHYHYLRDRYLTDPAVLEQLAALHRRAAATQALQLGLLNAAAGGSWTHPTLDRMIYGDGKVITPLWKAHPGDRRLDRITGELKGMRAERDAALHFEGTGETAWGTKFVLFATRGHHPHSRVILDAAYVPSPGAEAATAMACISRTAPLAPGAQGVIYDTALRGVHHQTLLRDLGLIPINRVTAAKAGAKPPRRRAADRRVEKLAYVETKTVVGPDDTPRNIDLYAQGGAIGFCVRNADGELIFTPLPRVRTHRNSDKSGRFRWYNDYRLPEHLGGGTITIRLHADRSDTERGFNRTENVRPIPASDPDFAALFRRRNDAESINRALDDSLWLRRAHSVGHQRQHLNVLGYALMVNSLALHRHRRQDHAPPEPNQATAA